MNRMPTRYVNGIPLYWGFEIGGELKAAVQAFYDACLGKGQPTAEQLALLCEYCVYFINAPCWEHQPTALGGGENPFLADVLNLRERAKTLASLESIRRFSEECVEIGIDPF